MYQVPLFREERIETMHALIRAHPLGLLITAGTGGLIANPLPFLLDAGQGERGTLRVHMARANPQWRECAGVAECLVAFQGPQAYVSPSWYETKRETGRVVPTWNYATVHAWGRPRVMDDPAWLREQIEALTQSRESGRAAPWAVSDAPEEFVAMQTKAIVGVEIEIARIEGKWKMSQNRPAADRTGVRDGFRAEGDAALAALVTARNGLDE